MRNLALHIPGTFVNQATSFMRVCHSEYKMFVVAAPKALERHFRPAEVAKMWAISVDTVRDLFRNEPGVLLFGNDVSKPGRKRAYVSMRIPESVLMRVHLRLSQAA